MPTEGRGMDCKRLVVFSLCGVLVLGTVACGDDSAAPAGDAEVDGGGEGGEENGGDGY